MFRRIAELLKQVHELLHQYVPVPPPKHGQPGATTWDKMWHKGSLYSHSLWVTRAVANAFSGDPVLSPWREGIPDSDAALLCHTAALHDIGKAGDLVFSYAGKGGHEGSGASMLLGRTKFLVKEDPGWKNVVSLLDVGGWSAQEKSLIIFLVACHSSFGITAGDLFLAGKFDSSQLREAFAALLEGLVVSAKEVGVDVAATGEGRLARLACFIGAMDCRGLVPVSCNVPELSDDSVPPVFVVPVEGIVPLWDHFDYSGIGVKMMRWFIRFVDSKQAWLPDD